jgi:hypothetical protein
VQEIGRRYLRARSRRRCRRTCPSRTRRSSGRPWTAEARRRASRRSWPRPRAKLRVDLKMHENQQSHLEAIFSRGDRGAPTAGARLSPRLPVRRLGRRSCACDLWDQAIEERRRHWPRGRALPRDHPGDGASALGSHRHRSRADFLRKEYRKALKDRLSPPCGKPYKKLLHPSSVAAAEAGARTSWSATTAASPATSRA